jgi:hypothetical protein
MPRKDGSTLKSAPVSPEKGLQRVAGRDAQRARESSWCVVGIDTSLTAVAACGIGYDSILKKMVGPSFADVRFKPEIDYYERLAVAAKAHEIVLEASRCLYSCELHRIAVAVEEPVPYGMISRGKMQSDYIKQQCEISGAVKGSLSRYGFKVIYEINNAQWKKTLRGDGVTIRKMPEGKWDVKRWAIAAYGLPDLPDLVKGKEGGKVPRPESGFGANAKAVQPDDIYDACAVMAWMVEEVQEGRSVLDVRI